jgi:hypothetical protein
MEDSALLIRLSREEREARDQLEAARQRFNQILSEIPSGIPQPDGNVRIQRAGADVRSLNRRSAEATKRLMDYLMYGTVPEGYKQP